MTEQKRDNDNAIIDEAEELETPKRRQRRQSRA
jgi:hypothetical protein